MFKKKILNVFKEQGIDYRKKNFNKKILVKNWKKFLKVFKEQDIGYRKR